MLWPIIDPIFVRFWARPEWNGSGLLNIKIRYQLFFSMNLPVYESLLAIIFLSLKSKKCVTPF